MHKKIIPFILAAALLISGLLSILSIHGLQGNARMINYTGVVRGATQRLIKQELNGQKNDELIKKLDSILFELSSGEGENHLGKMQDAHFQQLLAQMQVLWSEMKAEILYVRQGADGTKLYALSEKYFELADVTVSAAEEYSEKQVLHAETGLIILSAVFLLVAAALAWFGMVQERRRRALKKAEDLNKTRSENLKRMSQALRAPMDEISELMYVSDLENYELLFINETGRKSFGITELTGQKCYKVLQGKDCPCEFCTTAFLSQGENYTWEHTNPITKKHYLLKDRLIQWDGRAARIEIAFDISEAEAEKQELKNMLDAEQMVMECVRTLYREHDLAYSIPIVLERLCSFLSADRAYINTLHNKLWYNDYEWCSPGITSQKELLQGLPLTAIASWLPVFERQECIILEDIAVLKEQHPDEFTLLQAQEITSLVAAPLEEDGQLRGMLGVDNPPPDRIRSIAPLLQTLCYFLLLAFRRSENEQQLSQLSYFDTLTSFYNRNRYMEDSAKLENYNGSLGIVYLDVNGLKDVNDQFGHAYGDKMLVACTRQMREVFEGAEFYRIGGDEFVIFSIDTAKEPFFKKVNALRRVFGIKGEYHVAIGAQWTSKVTDVQQLLAKADAGMYEDKKGFYRNNPISKRYRHNSDNVLHLSDPETVQKEISEKHFIVYLQPQVSSNDKSTVGAEALIRYQPSPNSIVLPENFLPLLKDSQTISQIDFYVFEYACSQLKLWAEQGKPPLPVSVNFSSSSLIEQDFVSRLAGICKKYGVEKKYLWIELTEAAQEPAEINLKSLIHDLRQQGFFVSIDAFGTEHANLNLLFMLEFDVLKLDKTLIRDLAKNSKARTVLECIVNFCKKMNVKVVAGGIETEEQLSICRLCGVELAQGFLFSEPVPIEEYESKFLQD